MCPPLKLNQSGAGLSGQASPPAITTMTPITSTATQQSLLSPQLQQQQLQQQQQALQQHQQMLAAGPFATAGAAGTGGGKVTPATAMMGAAWLGAGVTRGEGAAFLGAGAGGSAAATASTSSAAGAAAATAGATTTATVSAGGGLVNNTRLSINSPPPLPTSPLPAGGAGLGQATIGGLHHPHSQQGQQQNPAYMQRAMLQARMQQTQQLQQQQLAQTTQQSQVAQPQQLHAQAQQQVKRRGGVLLFCVLYVHDFSISSECLEILCNLAYSYRVYIYVYFFMFNKKHHFIHLKPKRK